MMFKVTSRDVQEIVSKLSSDKGKTREEGIKLLNTWLHGERASGFCRYISQETSVLKPNEIPHSETWPFLISLVTQCVSLDISSSKRRLPKIIFAKTLRTVVQRAEDATSSGKKLLLLPVVKLLFNHICDVLKDAPSFQSEYGSILRHLLAVRDYRFHMRKRVYCSLVNLYLEKVQTSLTEISGTQSISTLHSLLANPPGDFPDVLREDIVRGFVSIFSSMGDEGKVLRSLIECVNTYLLRDGPNLGCQSWEIHDAVKQFVFRYWISTCDHVLKDALVLYLRLQLSLVRGAADGGALVEQVVDVIGKELDQTTISSAIARNDKCVNLTSSQSHLVELAAFSIGRALVQQKAHHLKKEQEKRTQLPILKKGL